MDSDKNRDFLEKHLKTLGQKVRIDILKKLNDSHDYLSFSKLQRAVLEHNFSSVNFSFHLKALKKCDLIDSAESGYYITKLGKQILVSIISIEQVLLEKSKTRMIRTSKYSKEIFKSTKIEEYLITEGGMESHLARQIAREVEERLAKTNIKYLTAPLMREYINGILLENGLEEVRHKLTRLGTPPYEVSKLFNSTLNKITPETFIKRLGSDVSEQFLLLNLLPKNLADLYLSGEIALLHLNYWSLRPLSVYINTETIIKYLYNRNIDNYFDLESKTDVLRLILGFTEFIYKFRQFYSEDLLLGDFNTQLLAKIDLLGNSISTSDLLTSQIYRFNNSFNDDRSHLSLGFNNGNNSTKKSMLLDPPVKKFLYSLVKNPTGCIGPQLLFGYLDFIPSESTKDVIDEIFSQPLKDNMILIKNDSSNLLTSTNIKIKNPKQNQIILDKILVNLHRISVDANQNDDLFYELLQEKLDSVFDLFSYKEKFVKQKLIPIKEWNEFSNLFQDNEKNDIFGQFIKSISFFGLNKAILNHCGIELERTKSSMTFALNTLSLMGRIIQEKNEDSNDRFILSQPHNDRYLKDCWYNGVPSNRQGANQYSSEIISTNSNLSLEKKLPIFKKFENILDGGSIFNQKINASDISLKVYLSLVSNLKINAISLRNFGN
ncbi:MAG: anaerobic ribonucleoside-triphosphate reductase [Candidatus Hodarchaeales archaeon]